MKIKNMKDVLGCYTEESGRYILAAPIFGPEVWNVP
jgi:hypothetical protein